MTEDLSDLDKMIESLRRLEGLPEETAKRAAEKLDALTKSNIAAGQDPDGKPWPKTKDGHKPLENAAANVATKVHGALIRQTLTGHEVFHNYGTKRVPKRQIIPDVSGGNVPEPVAEAVTQAANEAFKELIK